MDGERKIRVAVVFGGRGPEHAISCLGAGNVLRVIDRDKYDVVGIGITSDGTWLEVSDDPMKLAITGRELPSVESVAKPDAHVVPGHIRATWRWWPARLATFRTSSATST